MTDRPRHIDKVKTNLPDRISDPPKPIIKDVPDDGGRNARYKERQQQELSDTSNKRETIMEKLQSVKDRGFKAIGSLLLRWIINFIMDVFLSFGVHKKDAEGKPIPKLDDKGKPVKDKNGNPVYVISWGQTFITVLVKNRAEIAFLGTVLGYQVFGASVLEWIERIVIALGL